MRVPNAASGAPDAEADGRREPPGSARDPLLGRLPAPYWTVPYVAGRFPGARTVRQRPGLALGANCQLFAYEVLRHFGLRPPPLRSAELWEDTRDTVRVTAPRALDLLLFNPSDDPYGAHLGVCAGGGRVLHLCGEIGRPAVWDLADFAARERYRVVVGAKRVTAGQPPDDVARSER
ncbi:hydrolase [Streptomyces sp. SID8352]|uniref:hydrolase n=1 Tax=Streptomyces sp. SID8352 TaxID=2690338 RepID=UPI001F2C37C3|nr:hydrolase [Streptomyces sp. SID8352]